MKRTDVMKPGQGLVIALGYRIITVLIATVGICYYLAGRREVAQVLHEAEQEAEEKQSSRAGAADTVA